MAKNFKGNNYRPSNRINDDIVGYDNVRVIYKKHTDSTSDEDFNRVMHLSEAKRLADKMELDLIEVNNKTDIPILKIEDYSKYLWEQKKKQKERQKSNASLPVKEIQLSVGISEHDIMTKFRKAKEFIDKGHKVRVVLTMKGRELGRREESKKSLYVFLSQFGDDIAYDLAPKDENNKCYTIIRSKK